MKELEFHFQAVILDDRDYILEYKSFNHDEIGKLVRYINLHCTKDDVREIRIKRWNGKKH